MSDSMKKAWEILKTTDFQRFLVEVFGIPSADAKKLISSKSLKQAISQGQLTEAITENEFEELINLAEAEQYENLLERLEEINSNYAVSQKKKHNQRQQERYANDPEYRERIKQYYREYNRRRKERKE